MVMESRDTEELHQNCRLMSQTVQHCHLLTTIYNYYFLYCIFGQLTLSKVSAQFLNNLFMERERERERNGFTLFTYFWRVTEIIIMRYYTIIYIFNQISHTIKMAQMAYWFFRKQHQQQNNKILLDLLICH